MARTLTGLVSSAKGNKTITVAIRTRKTHPIYKKQYTVTTKFMAHDEVNKANEGDRVLISESRPLSARKRWILVDVLEKAHVKHVEQEVDLAEDKEEKPVAKKAEAKAKPSAEKPKKAPSKKGSE